MGYFLIIGLAVVLVPLIYFVAARKPGTSIEGEEPVGKPVMVTEPSADEATPAASSIQKDTTEAQRHTPAA